MIETLRGSNQKVITPEHDREVGLTSGQQPEGRWFESNPRYQRNLFKR